MYSLAARRIEYISQPKRSFHHQSLEVKRSILPEGKKYLEGLNVHKAGARALLFASIEYSREREISTWSCMEFMVGFTVTGFTF